MATKIPPAEVQAERNQATADYLDEQDALRARTAKLRAERLAREAAGIKPVIVPAKPAPVAAKTKAKPAKAKAAKAKLAAE
jgi:hypothetical protein